MTGTDERPFRRGAVNVGFLVCALAGIVAVIASRLDLARGPAEGERAVTLSAGNGIALLGGVAAAVFVLLAFFGGQTPARVAGLTIAATAAWLAGLTAVGAKLSREFESGAGTDLRSGGWVLLLSAALFLAGMYLAAFRAEWVGGGPVSSALPIALAVGGLILPPLQGLAIGLGATLRRSEDLLTRRRGVGAIFLASFAAVGWVCVVAGGLLFGSPP